jgi:hypothetical protein
MEHKGKRVDPEMIAFLGEERIQRFAETPQDPLYHAEGDVLVHLGMMLEVYNSWVKPQGFSLDELEKSAVLFISMTTSTRMYRN